MWGRRSGGIQEVSVGADAAALGWESVAGGLLSGALAVGGCGVSCGSCLWSVLWGAVVVVGSGGGAGEVESGWEGVVVPSRVGASAGVDGAGASTRVEGASGEVGASSLREGGACVSSAVEPDAAAGVVATYGSVLLVAGVEAARPRTSWICWEASSSDQRTSRVWKSSMRTKASGGECDNRD